MVLSSDCKYVACLLVASIVAGCGAELPRETVKLAEAPQPKVSKLLLNKKTFKGTKLVRKPESPLESQPKATGKVTEGVAN